MGGKFSTQSSNVLHKKAENRRQNKASEFRRMEMVKIRDENGNTKTTREKKTPNQDLAH